MPNCAWTIFFKMATKITFLTPICIHLISTEMNILFSFPMFNARIFFNYSFWYQKIFWFNFSHCSPKCIYHTAHVFTIQYMYVPYSTCMYHTVHVCTIQYMYLPYSTCMYHTVHVCTIQYIYVPYSTCIYHTVHV